MKVNLFVVGAAKAGTTTLAEYLKRHRECYCPDDKEPHYFGELAPKNLKKYSTLSEYHSLYKNAKTAWLADFSTSYLYSKSAANEIYNYNKNSKIIIILRNPIGRAYSLYLHQVKSLEENESFRAALRAEESRISQGYPYGYHYVSSGMYYKQVRRYIDLFGENNVKILFFEDLISDMSLFLKQVENFLSLEKKIDRKRIVTNESGVIKSKSIARVLSVNFPFKRKVKRVIGNVGINKIKKTNMKKANPVDSEVKERLREIFVNDVAMLNSIIDTKRVWKDFQ